jgi:cytochrome c556
MKRLFCIALLSTLVGGCDRPTKSPATQLPPDAAASPSPHQPPSTSDTRKPLPLLARMAEHQRENMRDHLAAIQEILDALSTRDFAGVERAASRIGYSEHVGRMCSHMGAGAPGFTDTALNFHRTADTIGVAAKKQDADATLRAVTATLQTCVSCHATFRQEIVDDVAWVRITSRKTE